MAVEMATTNIVKVLNEMGIGITIEYYIVISAAVAAAIA